MIYFMQPTTGGPVKIGHTADVDARHRQLESHYGQPLAILATIDGGRDEERELHQRFGHLRFGRTEQFRPGSALMAFIGRPLLVGPNLDTIEAMWPSFFKLPTDVMDSARIVAAYTGESIAEMLGDILRPILAKREKEEAAKRARSLKEDPTKR